MFLEIDTKCIISVPLSRIGKKKKKLCHYIFWFTILEDPKKA